MPKRVPTLGYPSRTAAVMALRKQGLSNREVADKIGISIQAASGLAASRARHMQKTVLVDRTVLEDLEPHAQRRGISGNELIRRLLDVIALENMIDAVLDDGAKAGGTSAASGPAEPEEV